MYYARLRCIKRTVLVHWVHQHHQMTPNVDATFQALLKNFQNLMQFSRLSKEF